MSSGVAICGGKSAVKAIDPQYHAVIVGSQAQVEGLQNRTFQKYEPVEMKTQVVAGVNIFAKIEVDNNEFIHVKLFRNLQGVVQVTGHQSNMTAQDQL